MVTPTSILSTPTPTTSPLTPPRLDHNPYARNPSRRAIACITCARAKTKCDKTLPSCSRCIMKGIKCEPRSTRRNPNTSHRSGVRKSTVNPKGCQISNVAMSLENRFIGPLATPPLDDQEDSAFLFCLYSAADDSGSILDPSDMSFFQPPPVRTCHDSVDFPCFSNDSEHKSDYWSSPVETPCNLSDTVTTGMFDHIFHHGKLQMKEQLIPAHFWPQNLIPVSHNYFDPNMIYDTAMDAWHSTEHESLVCTLQHPHRETMPQFYSRNVPSNMGVDRPMEIRFACQNVPLSDDLGMAEGPGGCWHPLSVTERDSAYDSTMSTPITQDVGSVNYSGLAHSDYCCASSSQPYYQSELNAMTEDYWSIDYGFQDSSNLRRELDSSTSILP